MPLGAIPYGYGHERPFEVDGQLAFCNQATCGYVDEEAYHRRKRRPAEGSKCPNCPKGKIVVRVITTCMECLRDMVFLTRGPTEPNCINNGAIHTKPSPYLILIHGKWILYK